MAKTYDWDEIEIAYRTGRYSNVQLEKEYGPKEGTIRSHMKKHGVLKDLDAPVQQRIRDKLLKSEVKDMDNPDEEDIVEASAQSSVDILLLHRKHIGTQLGLVEKVEVVLVTQLETGKKSELSKEGKLVDVDIDLESTVKILNGLTQSTERLVKLGRQNFNLDADGPKEKPEEKYTDEELLNEIRNLTSGPS